MLCNKKATVPVYRERNQGFEDRKKPLEPTGCHVSLQHESEEGKPYICRINMKHLTQKVTNKQ